jgi:dihydrofolate reductase
MVKLIACIGPNGELGKGLDLVYYNKEDMEFFRFTTSGNVVIMGYNTFLSLGSRPLPNRKNIVLTEEFHTSTDKVEFLNASLDKVLEIVQKKYPNKDIFIIGGAYVYNQAISLKLVDELLLTIMNYGAPADVYIDTDLIRDNYKPIGKIKDIKENDITVGKIITFTRR